MTRSAACGVSSTRSSAGPPADRGSVVRVLAAVDKFKGSLSAPEVASAVTSGCRWQRVSCIELPLADGGEGMLEALGGANRSTAVEGPLGARTHARWRLAGPTAVIEAAEAAGLTLAGGARANDPVRASTTGVGELIAEAIRSGAKRIVVGIGGSATSDGGAGAVAALRSLLPHDGIELVVACDVTTRFLDAGRVFGPQKGADARDVEPITNRLHGLHGEYLARFGLDVADVPGSGAAGGLAGGLAALGGTLVSGFNLVAHEVGLREQIAKADLVITGEGTLDETSRAGKVVGGVRDICESQGTAVHAVVGQSEGQDWIEHTSLTERFGLEQSMARPAACISRAVASLLRTL